MAPDHDETAREPERRERRRVSARVWVLLVVGLLVVLFGVDNRQSVEVGYLVDEADVSLVWVMAASLVAGAVLERAYTFVRGRRRED